MSEATQTQAEEANTNSADGPQSEVTFEYDPDAFVDTRTDEERAAIERLHKQIEEYRALYERGDIGETAYDSAILHRLAGQFSIIREFQHAFTGQILRFMRPESECGYGLTLDEAIKKAESCLTGKTADKLFNELKCRSASNLDWLDFDELFRLEPAAAEALWKRLKVEAREDFESGSLSAKIFETTSWRRDPWRRAQYVGIRDAFIDDYKPRGAVELSMLDMAVTAYFLYYYWTEIMMRRSDTEAMPELFTYAERRKMERLDGRYEWVPPRVSEQDALEHAAHMADRFRREFFAAIRGLRDYRRYGPVIINNDGQVNIAADGGQQVNVQKSKRRAKTGGSKTRGKRTGKAKPIQLASKSAEESIRMEPASEIRSAQVVKRA